MPNKNISNLNLRTPNTGDFLAIWRTSTNTTDKIYINNLVALSPEAALTIPLTGCVSGASNVGPSTADGLIFLRNQSGILEFKKIAGGSNVTIGNETGRVVINAADPPAVPITSLANVGVGPGLIYSGLQSNQANIRSISGEGGISVYTIHPSTISISGLSGINVSNGQGTIFHSQIANNKYQFKTIEAGTGVSITNNTGTVQINFSGLSYDITYGSGDNMVVPTGNGTSQWSVIRFTGSNSPNNSGSPFLNIPAGNGVYEFDAIVGYFQGSNVGDALWLQLYNSGTATPLIHGTRPYLVAPAASFVYRQIVMKHIQRVSGPTTIVIRTFCDEGGGTYENPRIISTGTTFSYKKINS